MTICKFNNCFLTQVAPYRSHSSSSEGCLQTTHRNTGWVRQMLSIERAEVKMHSSEQARASKQPASKSRARHRASCTFSRSSSQVLDVRGSILRNRACNRLAKIFMRDSSVNSSRPCSNQAPRVCSRGSFVFTFSCLQTYILAYSIALACQRCLRSPRTSTGRSAVVWSFWNGATKVIRDMKMRHTIGSSHSLCLRMNIL